VKIDSLQKREKKFYLKKL